MVRAVRVASATTGGSQLAILPFEPDWYAARGVRQVEFVGHPLTGEVAARYDRAASGCRLLVTLPLEAPTVSST